MRLNKHRVMAACVSFFFLTLLILFQRRAQRTTVENSRQSAEMTVGYQQQTVPLTSLGRKEVINVNQEENIMEEGSDETSITFRVPHSYFVLEKMSQQPTFQLKQQSYDTVKYLLDLRKSFVNKIKFFSNRTYEVQKTIKLKSNNTIAGSKILIYNRVSKAGSSTILTILRMLGYSKKKFKFETSQIFDSFTMTVPEELSLLAELYEKSRNENFVFDRHLYFIDTEILSIPRRLRPNWINVVRDPIDRFVSLYYYLTSSNDRMPEIVEGFFNKSLDECVAAGNDFCNLDPSALASCQYCFFCGSSPICQNAQITESGVQLAKYNVESAFALVGITSSLEATICGFESYLPLYFAGAMEAFEEMKRKSADRQNSAAYKKPVSEQVLEFVRSRLVMQRDLDFYSWAVQRFHRQIKLLESRCDKYIK